MAGVLSITLKHDTTKHAQTIGLLEQSHALIKQSLKIGTAERRFLWHKYISNALLNYNTSYHSSIGCEPSRVFHGRILYNILDLNLGIRPQKNPAPDSEIAQDVLEQTETIFQDVRRNAMQAYIKYKAQYDKKANATKLKQSDYVYILQPKADHQGSKIPFTDFRWIGPYIVEKVLPNNNYVVRKIGTNKTQILHRMRLRQFTSRQPIPTYQSHHANGNQTRKLSLNMTIYMLEHGSVNTTSQCLTVIVIMWCHPIHQRSRYDREKPMQQGVLQEPHKRTPQTFPPPPHRRNG